MGVCLAFVFQLYRYSLTLFEPKRPINQVRMGAIGTFILVAMTFVYGSQNYFIITYIIASLLIYTFFKHFYKTSISIALYSANNYLLQLLSIRIIIFTVIALITNESIHSFSKDPLKYALGAFITYSLTSILMMLFQNHYNLQLQKTFMQNIKQVQLVVIFQCTTIAFLLLSNFLNFIFQISDLMFLSFCLISYIMVSVAFYLVYDYSIRNMELGQLKIKVNNLEDQLEKQLTQYQQMSEYIVNFRKLRHDYKFLIKGINAQLALGDLEKAKNFLTDVEGEMDTINSSYTKYSNNPLLQAILSDFAATCDKKSISFDAALIMPSSTSLNDMELCRIFSNLITNAIEACEKITDPEKRHITIKSKNNDPWLSILVENSFDGTINQAQDKLKTTKSDKENHGLGLQNVEAIIEKYEGLYTKNIDSENGIFKTIINLPLNVN